MIAALLLLMTAPPRVQRPTPAPHPEAAAGPASASAMPAPPLTGGWQKLNRTAPEVHKPFRAAVAAITPAKHPGAHLLAVERQVVAGTNYRFTLKLRDGSRWQATVWHKLDGRFEVNQTARLD